jgi:quinol monooxygenase YgiN
MIGIVATLTVQAGKEAEFEAIFKDLSAKVRANEPGNMLYQLTKVRGGAPIYKVLELYADQESLAAHGKTDYFKAAGGQMAGTMAAAPQIEYLDAVV